MNKNQFIYSVPFVILCLFGIKAEAGVVVGGTRVVYDGSKREASLSIRNPDKTPYLIQSWADADGPLGESKGAAKPPFVVTPPLFRLDPGNENMIRIIRTGGNLPEDRESVYWMNVKSIGASPNTDRNVLQIAVKTRIKLFYRPAGINPPLDDDYKKLTFLRIGGQLQVTNPTPYYISFYSLKVGDKPVNTDNIMVPPKGTASYSLPHITSGQLSWQVLNDFGGYNKVISAPLN